MHDAQVQGRAEAGQGHWPQRGFLPQTRAPSSIMAWLWRRASPAGRRRRASSAMRAAAGPDLTGLSTSKTRAMTRSTLASMQATGRLKAMLAMAAAV